MDLFQVKKQTPEAINPKNKILKRFVISKNLDNPNLKLNKNRKGIIKIMPYKKVSLVIINVGIL